MKSILILGSGGLKIGQAGEFDYSGSQAIKALKEEGFRTILVNPNIATVQTDEGLADEVYLQPLNHASVLRIIEIEKPCAILLGFGGQTGLNLGLELYDSGTLEKYGIEVLGTSPETIKLTEDRQLFKEALVEIDVHSPFSYTVSSVAQALIAAKDIGYPLMMRSGFSLGGLGSGRIDSENKLIDRVREALSSAPHVLIEEYLKGWKEVEYEVMRDRAGNVITICNMENFDPMGIHTGESIVVAPSQTLSNREYQMLRSVALKTITHLGIVGECNIQYALHPTNGEYRVIEVNARLSRSSALASKATGYPIAFVAAKLSIGKLLSELKNVVTGKTSAFFEPALDYCVVKMPRWDTHKFKAAEREIGSEMKSVGEVMAIARNFPEALQKACRMLNIGVCGVTDYSEKIAAPMDEVEKATDRRLFAIYKLLQKGVSVAKIHEASFITKWFLEHLESIAKVEKKLIETQDETYLLEAKKLGFSDQSIGTLWGKDALEIRALRKKLGIVPVIKQIDTLAGEFAAQTNYLYLTYNGRENDISQQSSSPIIVLGSGPYCIGSSVEFDWCAVNALKSLHKLKYATVMINSNPETVSTDYDESGKLYFEELTQERVMDIADFENPEGILISVGGQIANNLVNPLHAAGYPILGTSAESIQRAENRMEFSTLLTNLNVDQPQWEEVKTLDQAKKFARRVSYPILVRPSFVLSGAAMNVVYDEGELSRYLTDAARVSKGHPVVISQFIENAKELEIDGVAKEGVVVVEAITEHIENAGVHSGDATVVLPPQRLYLETIRQAKQITKKIVSALKITGPFNIQFLAKENHLMVIECNVRAARSFPFVSKVTNHNLIDISIKAIMGAEVPSWYQTLDLGYVGVKTPQFSYSRLKGANPVAQVEMASTGEVACIGANLHEAFMQSWFATGQSIRGKRVLVSIGGDKKGRFLEVLKTLESQGWELFSTENTHEFLVKNGVANQFLYKTSQSLEPNIKESITGQKVDLIINIPNNRNPKIRTDGFTIRRLAIDHNIPLITNMQLALLFLHCLAHVDYQNIPVKSWKNTLAGEVYA